MEQLAYSEFDGNLSTDVGIVVVFPIISTSMALSEKNHLVSKGTNTYFT